MKISINRPCVHWSPMIGCLCHHQSPIDCHLQQFRCYEAIVKTDSEIVRDWRIQVLGLNARDAATDPNLWQAKGLNHAYNR